MLLRYIASQYERSSVRDGSAPVFETYRTIMTHHEHNHDHSRARRFGRFSLSQSGVGTRLLLAAVLVVLIWAAIIALVL